VVGERGPVPAIKNHASWDQWVDAYEVAYFAPGDIRDQACPNCGKHCLNLVFVVHGKDGRGHAAFWCGNCLNGLVMSTVAPPEGATRDDETPVEIPNYAVVAPGTPADLDA
jgi:hypothetical protein